MIGQLAGHEIQLEIEDVLDKINFFNVVKFVFLFLPRYFSFETLIILQFLISVLILSPTVCTLTAVKKTLLALLQPLLDLQSFSRDSSLVNWASRILIWYSPNSTILKITLLS